MVSSRLYDIALVVVGLVVLQTTATVALTDWTLAAHGATRSLYKGTTTPWQAKYPVANFSLPRYNAVVNSPNGAGGMIQREDDGRIHLQLLGSQQEPRRRGFGPAARRTPPYVLELDGNSGRIMKEYDLSPFGRFFSHPLRYTPDGHVIVTLFSNPDLYTSNDHTLVVLDRNSTEVLWVWKAPAAAELVEVANSNPKSLIVVNSQNITSMLFTKSMSVPDESTLIVSDITSTIIFGPDGATLYNDGLGGRVGEPTGIYRVSKLPITTKSTRTRVVIDCYTYPWIVSLDTSGNIYAVCYMGRPHDQNPVLVSKFDANGKLIWRMYQATAEFMTLSDDETVVFAGNNAQTVGYSTTDGKVLWNITPESLKRPNEFQLECFWGGNPWVPRHPVPLASGKIAFLCASAPNAYDIRVIDQRTGVSGHAPVPLHVIPDGLALFADGMDNVYVFGYYDTDTVRQNVVFQRVNVGQ